MKEISCKDLKVIKDGEYYTVIDNGHIWKMDRSMTSHIKVADKVYYFKDALVDEKYYTAKINKGILSTYVFSDRLVIETLVWIDEERNVRFELIPIEDDKIDEINWPGYFKSEDKDGYSALPIMQGVLLKNDYDYTYDKLDFDGFFYSHDAYVSFFMQYEKGYGYMLINDSPDTKYDVIHKADVLGTSIGIRHVESLGEIRYRRTLIYHFQKGLDYCKASKYYRRLMIESGRFKSLKEKTMTLENIDKMVGASLIHFGIKSHTDPASSFYDPKNSEDIVVSFAYRLNELKEIKKHYDGHLYVHIDGWAEPGYDNKHPDYYPVCIKAGGEKGLKAIVDYLKENDDVIALHDQYRDYYHSADTYDVDNSVLDKDEKVLTHARWAGGRQDYLCATMALDYVKRNFSYLFESEIYPSASYLDVFTCNEMDECLNPRHIMTRKECADLRKACFKYLVSKGIIPTSEECTDWALDTLVSCHYGPYEFMLKKPGTKKMGIPIPLFNLVWHDAILLPWMMDIVDGEDFMLYALLNGGMPYLIREGAYPDVDGAFGIDEKLDEQIKRCKVVNDLHRKVAYSEMVDHRIIDKDGLIQEATFSDGTTVTINLNDNSYSIK